MNDSQKSAVINADKINRFNERILIRFTYPLECLFATITPFYQGDATQLSLIGSKLVASLYAIRRRHTTLFIRQYY